VTGNSVEEEHRLSLATPVQDRESDLISQDRMPHQHMLAEPVVRGSQSWTVIDLIPALAAVAIFVLRARGIPTLVERGWCVGGCPPVRCSALGERSGGPPSADHVNAAPSRLETVRMA
jgi:hypothetical protein